MSQPVSFSRAAGIVKPLVVEANTVESHHGFCETKRTRVSSGLTTLRNSDSG